MLKNAVAAIRGEHVTAAALWADHADLERQITEAEARIAAGNIGDGDELLEALAANNKAGRVEARRLRAEALDHAKELRDAQRALAKKAAALEAKEKKAADSASWMALEGLMRRRATLGAAIDRQLTELATRYVELNGIEQQIFETMPKHHRPNHWPTNWGAGLGRGIALRLKVLSPAIDGLANGHPLYVPRDQPSVSVLIEASNEKLREKKPNGESK